MTQGHERQESPFFLAGKAVCDTETVRDDGLVDVGVCQHNSLGITWLYQLWDPEQAKNEADLWSHSCS